MELNTLQDKVQDLEEEVLISFGKSCQFQHFFLISIWWILLDLMLNYYAFYVDGVS